MSELVDHARVTWGLSERWFRETFQKPLGLLIILAVQPAVWYVLFGSLFEQMAALPAFPASDYRAFILPGIAVMMALGYFVAGGHCIIADLREGVLQKLWAAPISKLSVVSARLVVMATLNVIQTVFLFALAYLDGVRFEAGLLGAVVIVGMAALVTAATTALSMTIAYVLKHEFSFNIVTSFLVLPVVFVSNAFVPTSMMPTWLRAIAEVNPVSTTITAMRTLVIDGWVMDDVMPAIGILVGVTSVAILIATLSFTRKIEGEPLFEAYRTRNEQRSAE